MRKQFLWVGKAGFYYDAPGNISVGNGSKGSVTAWWHPGPSSGTDQVMWEASFDNNNYVKLGFSVQNRLTFVACSGGTKYQVHWDAFYISNFNFWMPVTCTWDFTTPGQGKLRLYLDGQACVNQVDNAQAPLGEAMRLYLGARAGTTQYGLDGYLDNLAVWNDVMTLAQHQALKGGASDFATRQSMRRRSVKQSDGTGVMTLLAGFDGQYDAEYAAGDATARWLVESSAYNEFARIDDGSRGRGRRYAFYFGMPRHDNSDDDRVPMRAVLQSIRNQGADQYTVVTDRTDHSEIAVTQVKPIVGQGQGMGWLREAIDPGHLLRPATVKMRVHVPAATTPVKTKVCLGPVTYINGGLHGNNFSTWGTGEVFTVVADGANTASSFKTNLWTGRVDGYWVGAEVSLRTGTGAGCRLKVTGYTAATGVVTVAGALGATPAAGDLGMVDFRGRIVPTNNPLTEQQSMESWLWEEYGADKPWTEIECQYGTNSGTGFTRYQRGRTNWMDLIESRSGPDGAHMMFGRNGWELPPSYSCVLLLESLIIEGPGTYQALDMRDHRGRRGHELADHFMLRDMLNGQSTRVWRSLNCGWGYAAPTVNPNAADVMADLAKAGTWRHQCAFLGLIKPHVETEYVIAVARGIDESGVKRLGYLRGTWNETVNRVTWVDEPAPAGKSNPFFNYTAMTPWERSDASFGTNGMGSSQILEMPDGTWTMLVAGTEDDPDHYLTRALHGAPDRWSFDAETQWWNANPMLPGIGGVDMIPPMFGGISLFGNRDAEWMVMCNPYARAAERRYAGYCRFKTMLPLATAPGSNKRPVAGWTSPDLKSFFLQPHGNMLSPLPIGEAYALRPYAVSDDVTGMVIEFLGGIVRLWASDDDRHFQQTIYNLLPDSIPVDTFRLGDKRVYMFAAGGIINLAYQGFNRESFYQLNSGQTGGWIETSALVRPESGWGSLILNVAPEQGTVRVEVLDARTEEALAGFGLADCGGIAEGIERRVTWGGLDLAELTAQEIRLRVHLSRANTGNATPKVYSWQIAALPVRRPTPEDLKVEGKVNPAGLLDTTPSFSWDYSDPQGKGQAAYEMIVASTKGKLDANEGDLWRSGVVVSDEQGAEYAGVPLADETTYFWKVRVQNAEGTWSEEW